MTGFDPDGDVNFQLNQLLNNGLEFDDNLQGTIIEFTTSDGDNRVDHELGFVPIGWIKIFQDAKVELWSTRRSEWDNNKMFLQSSASKVTVRLFVL